MKKTVLTLAIVLGMTIGTFAQEDGGIFGRGPMPGNELYESTTNSSGPLMLPQVHGTGADQSGETAPLGTGALLLIGFGAAYALKKKNK